MICVFCGADAPPSKEHIYSNWVREGIWAQGPTTVTRTLNGEIEREYPITGLTWILRRSLCGACNSGWMSTYLEDAVKPWLLPAMRGGSVEFIPPVQRLIAAWAVTKALEFELKRLETGKRGFAPSSNLHWLYAHRANPEPPPGCHVFIAAVDAQLGTAKAQTGWHTATTSLPPQDMEFYLATFAVGYLVFQVFGQDFRESDHKARTGKRLAEFWRPDWLVSYINAIWPARDITIRWPRDHILKKGSLPWFSRLDTTTARMVNLDDHVIG